MVSNPLPAPKRETVTTRFLRGFLVRFVGFLWKNVDGMGGYRTFTFALENSFMAWAVKWLLASKSFPLCLVMFFSRKAYGKPPTGRRCLLFRYGNCGL